MARGVFQCKVTGLTPNLQPGGPVPRIYNPLEPGSPVIPPGHWVVEKPGERHFPYTQMWAPSGVSLTLYTCYFPHAFMIVPFKSSTVHETPLRSHLIFSISDESDGLACWPPRPIQRLK